MCCSPLCKSTPYTSVFQRLLHRPHKDDVNHGMVTLSECLAAEDVQQTDGEFVHIAQYRGLVTKGFSFTDLVRLA